MEAGMFTLGLDTAENLQTRKNPQVRCDDEPDYWLFWSKEKMLAYLAMCSEIAAAREKDSRGDKERALSMLRRKREKEIKGM